MNNNQEDHTIVLLPPALTESFEICLARVVDLKKDQKSVETVVCGGMVKGCVANIVGNKGVCRHCINIRNESINALAPGVKVSSLDDFHVKGAAQLNDDEFQKIVDGAASTITTFYRRDVEGPARHWFENYVFRKIFTKYMAHSLFIADSLSNLLKSTSCNRIEFFNGRIVPTRAAMVVAQKLKKDFNLLEVTGREKRLTTVHNNSVHDINLQKELLSRYIEKGEYSLESGEQFFVARRNNEITNHASFTANQKIGLLTVSEKPILAIFTSSADELKVAGNQWFTDASIDPTSFIKKVSNLLGKEYRIIVRMHPNQAGDRTGASMNMLAVLLRTPNVEVIPPKSEISSYELIDLSQAVLTFGSTIGLEATFWGKPSLMAGRAIWDFLDVCYPINDAEELVCLLEKDLKPRSRADAVKVGSYYLDGTGYIGSLEWQRNRTFGFSVDTKNLLNRKRSSFFYWLSRLADRVLRL